MGGGQAGGGRGSAGGSAAVGAPASATPSSRGGGVALVAAGPRGGAPRGVLWRGAASGGPGAPVVGRVTCLFI